MRFFCVNLTFYLETSLTKNRNISGIHGHCHGHGCPSLYIEHFYLVLIIYILSSEKPLVLIIGCPKLQYSRNKAGMASYFRKRTVLLSILFLYSC